MNKNEAYMKLFFFLILLSFSLNVFAVNILELNPDIPLNEVPKGTEIRIKLPEDVIKKPLPLSGGDLYSNVLYYKNGNLEVLPKKTKKDKKGYNVVVHERSASATEPLCSLDLFQYSSPIIVLKSPELVLRVEDSARNSYPISFNGKPTFAVLDTRKSNKEDSLFPSLTIGCESGYLSGVFKGLTVGQFIKIFGKHLSNGLSDTSQMPPLKSESVMQTDIAINASSRGMNKEKEHLDKKTSIPAASAASK